MSSDVSGGEPSGAPEPRARGVRLPRGERRAQLLERGPGGDAPRQHLRVIHEQAERASRIVRNLLTFVRQSTPDQEAFDLSTGGGTEFATGDGSSTDVAAGGAVSCQSAIRGCS